MDNNYDVPDSTDWLSTPLKDFAELESALHCQICKEFYDTPMITSCNHTFCSKCIRTSLSSDGKCPACRASDQASKLRNNWALQEVVASFLAARPTALQVARKAQEEPRRSGKRKRTVVDEEEENAPARTTRSKSRRIAASQGSQHEVVEIEDSEDDEEYVEEAPRLQPDDGRVECPLGCGKRMKEEEVFGHLDKCEDEKKQAARAKSRTPLNGFAKPSSRPQERINELNYSMLKDNAFSKKLKELGIPNWGSKQQMIQRHREWVNIWNANCDSTRPRSKRELLHDLDTWERTQGGRAPNAYGLGSQVMRKDFDGDAYAKKHSDEFSRLIADARRKKNNPAAEAAVPSKDKDEIMDDVEDGKSPFFGSVNTSSRPPHAPVEFDGPRPYENNPEALSSIREKVKTVNEGKQIQPVMNQGFENSDAPVSSQRSPSATDTRDFGQQQQQQSEDGRSSIFHSTEPEATPGRTLRRDSSKDEHYTHARTGSPCDIPAHLRAAEPKKVPMFEISAKAVTDIDGDGPGAGER